MTRCSSLFYNDCLYLFLPQNYDFLKLENLIWGLIPAGTLSAVAVLHCPIPGPPFGPGAMGCESLGHNPKGHCLPGRHWGWHFRGVGQHCYFGHIYQVHELLHSTRLKKKKKVILIDKESYSSLG